MKKIVTAGVVVLFSAAALAQASGFQIKSVRLGMKPEEACGLAPVTDKASELLAKVQERTPGLKPMQTNECDGAIESFADVKLLKPSTMFFHERRLVALKLETHSMDMERLANVIDALRAEYGKPVLKRGENTSSFTWKKGGQTLILERYSPSWEENFVTLILRHDQGYSAFEKLLEHNKRVMDAVIRDGVRESVLK